MKLIHDTFAGAIRKAMSEDEMDDDEGDCHDDDILDDILHDNAGCHATTCHNQVAQSEYNFPLTNTTVVRSTDQLHDRLQGLHVSDHPSRTILDSDQTSPKPTVRVRRNSAGDETMLYCDFGDFNTQELISSPIEFEQGPSSSTQFGHQVDTSCPLPPEDCSLRSQQVKNQHIPADFLAYSTQSESSHHPSGVMLPLPRPIPQAAHFSPPSQNGVVNPSAVQAPVPVSGASSRNDNVLYQNMTFKQAPPPLLAGPPQLPPKSHIPPPYRPPPTQFIDGPVLRGTFEEEHFHKGHLAHHGTIGAMSSSDGGSHDSHNDSGYCVRGSGGPSPSLSGM